MSGGELGSMFEALSSDAEQAGGSMSEALARISEETAGRGEATVAGMEEAEAANARSFDDIAKGGSPAPDARLSRMIGDRLGASSSASAQGSVGAGYEAGAAERELGARRIVDAAPLNPGAHANEAFKVTLDDGSTAVYKPVSGEDASLRIGIPGGLADREVATSRMDEAFGFGRVPTTTRLEGPNGPGSVQQWVPGTPSLPHDGYPRLQQEQMAVLDYVTGNTDRHLGNYMTGANGDIVAIDHGYSFPESPDHRFGIRSDFVKNNVNVPLGDEVVAGVRGADPSRIRSMLQAGGLGQPAVDGALARFREVRDNGMITGEAWPGLIKGAYVTGPTERLSELS